MNSGFYSAATGMVTQSIAMNHITDNIVNASTGGYKKQEVLFHSFDKDLAAEVSKINPFAKSDVASGIDIIQGITDFSQGAIRYTGANEDIALEGDGFLSVETENGTFYTRSGKLLVNKDSELVTEDGYKVLSSGGTPITFEGSSAKVSGNFRIDDEGNVYMIDSSSKPPKKITFGKIGVFKFANPEKLERLGYGLWKNGDDNNAGIMASDAKTRQGYTEMSNVSAVESMVEMIVNERLYNANANMLKEMHRSLSQFLNAVIG